MKSEIRLFFDSLLFSYSSIFFTQNKWFGSVLCCITMLYPLQGICGLFCCMLVNAISLSLSLNWEKIRSGLYGFNAIMIGLALGAIYPYSETLVVLIFALSLLVLMLTVAMEGFFKKYNLPFLAFPFLACLWIVLLLSQQLDAGVSTDVLLFTSPQYLTIGEFSVYTLIEKLNNVDIKGVMNYDTWTFARYMWWHCLIALVVIGLLSGGFFYALTVDTNTKKVVKPSNKKKNNKKK